MISQLRRALQARLRHRRLMADVRHAAVRVFPGRTVRGGPFAGLKYPDWRSHGSAVFPKLLGSYEAELHGFVAGVLRSDPPVVVDVGCAEGYYAAGCAMVLPSSRVIAADLSAAARDLCREVALLNGVSDRVKIVECMDRKALMELGAAGRGWVISDCEGGEAGLFDPEVFRSLEGWFLLIEMHEFLVPGIEERLVAEASQTHSIEVIDSVDDCRRMHRWACGDMEDLPGEIRQEFYREGRPGLMRWLCASPKSPA